MLSSVTFFVDEVKTRLNAQVRETLKVSRTLSSPPQELSQNKVLKQSVFLLLTKVVIIVFLELKLDARQNMR